MFMFKEDDAGSQREAALEKGQEVSSAGRIGMSRTEARIREAGGCS